MKQRVPISQIMTTELILLNLTDDLYKAEKLFKNIKYGIYLWSVEKNCWYFKLY